MRNKTTSGLLALFLGGFGIHRFYLGQTLFGVLYLIFFWTLIPFFIGFIDAIVLFSSSEDKFNFKYNSKNSNLFSQNKTENNFTKTESKIEKIVEKKTFSSKLNSLPFPDRVDNINWHMNAISKGFKSNDLELVNLSYAKLIESIRQQNINDKNEFANHIEFVRNEYEEFRKDFGFEYPIQFLPPSERKKIAQTKDGKFILDSKTNFKLHLYNVEEENVKKIKKILDDEKTWNKENDLMPIFTLYNVKCSEVEDYIKKYKPIYDNYIINSIQKNADFSNYSEMDKADIIEEYKDEAINILEERADCDLKILFQESENPDEIDDELIKEYSFETISKYIGLQYYKEKIVTHWERKDFEDLIKADLAISGEQIEINEILLSLTLKNLNAICEKEENFFKRKNKAVEYLNENKELLKNVGKEISFRRIFKLKPLPSKFSNIKIEEISLSWAYVREYVKLIAETYKSSKRYTEEMKEDLDYVKFFKIESAEEYNNEFICQKARKECKKKFDKLNPPKLPFHIGCNCHLRSEYE